MCYYIVCLVLRQGGGVPLNNVTKVRLLRQMSKSELSVQSGLSRQSIYNIEKDVTNCTLKNLMKIADALRVDVKELI